MAMVAQSEHKRAAIYVRVSTAGQEQDGTSLGTQEAACRHRAAEHGADVEEAHVFREVHTGTELWERRELQRLREVIRRREVDCVICYAIDRLARDPVHLGVILSEAEHAGVAVEFVTEPLDDTPEGQLIRFVRGYAAKVEHEKFRERSMRGRRARLASGKPLPGPRPTYGYRWRDEAKSGYEPDPATAPIVRRIFAEAAAGTPLRRIAGGLTEDGIPRPIKTGVAAWRHSTVSDIFAEPLYTGRAAGWRHAVVKGPGTRTHRIRPDGEHVLLPEGVASPLVDAATFEAVQVRLRLNRERAVRNSRDPERYLLRGGYARCGYCGGAMSTYRGGAGGRYPHYQCARARASKYICTGAGISAQILDAAVWARIERILTDPSVIAAELERLRQDDPTEADLAAADAQLARVERQQRNLVDQLADLGGSVAAIVGEKLAALEAQRQQLTAEREAILGRRRAWEAAQAKLTELGAWCRNVAASLGTLSYEQKRLALDALGAQARVWRPDHTPRYAITAALPLDPAPSDCVRNGTQFRTQSPAPARA